MQWEYTSFRVATSGWVTLTVDDEEVNHRLKALGSGGWELVSVVPVLRNGYTNFCLFLLKRPLPPQPDVPFPEIVE